MAFNVTSPLRGTIHTTRQGFVLASLVVLFSLVGTAAEPAGSTAVQPAERTAAQPTGRMAGQLRRTRRAPTGAIRSEDFEGRSLHGWELEPSAQVGQAGQSQALLLYGSGHGRWVSVSAKDFKLEFGYRAGSDVGSVLFCASGEPPNNQEYQLLLGRDEIVLDRVVGEQRQRLAHPDYRIHPGQWYDVSVQVSGSEIHVSVQLSDDEIRVSANNKISLAASDSQPLPSGTVAFGCIEGVRFAYDDISLTSIGAPPPVRTVPDIVGKSADQALDILADRDLEGEQKGTEASDLKPGLVTRQDPRAGSVIPEDRTVRFWVSAGPGPRPPDRTVLDLVRMPLAQARAVLREMRLAGEEMGREPSDLRPGLVTRQDPRAGSAIPKDGIVRFWVSASPGRPLPDRTVPNIVRMSVEEALADLSRMDLEGVEMGLEASDLKPGLVTRQDPRAGSVIPEDRIVRFWVSEPDPTVPNIVGMLVEQVPGVLTNERWRLRGVEMGLEYSDLDAGLVARQDPGAGLPIPEDGIVRFWVSEPDPTVPNIVEMSVEEALTDLSRMDLAGEEIDTEPSDLDPGLVTRQDPRAGSAIPEDGVVRFWVSEPDPTVPSIVEMSVEEALAELTSRDLEGEEVDSERADLDPGLVTRQDPRAGSPIPEDGIVRFWVSEGPGPPLWAWMLGGVLLLGALGLVARRVAGPASPKVEFIPKADPGAQLIETSARLGLNVEIELRAVRDSGEQELESDGPFTQD
jgi:beta-lactam-binding protein with PASTA domain